MGSATESTVSLVVTIAVKAIVVMLIFYFFSDAPKQPRYHSGTSAAITLAALTDIYLRVPFTAVGMELAVVALYILIVIAAGVGWSLGVLLPRVFPGVVTAVALTLLVGCWGNFGGWFFPSVGGGFSLLGIIISLKIPSETMTNLAVILTSGGTVASVILPETLVYLTDVTNGFAQPLYNGPTILQPHFGFLWVAGSILTFVALRLRCGPGIFFLGRSSAPAPPTASAKPASAEQGYTRPLPSPAPDAYNMFNPADLPPRLAEYANTVYHACEDLGNFFGFQDSSVRNQAEHLLILLSNNRRYMTIVAPQYQPPSPVHTLHAKVFKNYRKWCHAVGVAPVYSKMSSLGGGGGGGPPAVVSRVVDLVLFFCIWGEAANLRHTSECLWFLYHKMMEEYAGCEGYTQTRSLYAGHFTDFVVTPIYELLFKSMKSKADHMDKRNYDDFNEFFWSRNCLQYHYSSADPSQNYDSENPYVTTPSSNSPLTRPFPDEIPRIPVAEALRTAPKTFLEKRSWLRGILALNRILEWHMVTFYLLAVIAFSRELVWGWVFSIQVASGVFWLFNLMNLTWDLVEVWSVYPGIQLAPTSICGSVFTLVARMIILVYQTLYLLWTFGPHIGKSNFGITADSSFWWWQYIWLSVLCMIPYVIQCLVQIIPSSVTRLYMNENEYVQSFLNILFPLSRLYVGKEVHESFRRSVIYGMFWLTLITWKLIFSYWFEVSAMVQPTLELTDDYVNLPHQSFARMSLLLVFRWFPQFLVYLIDMSIWYAVWQAFAGTAVGFSENLGDVKDMKDIRQNFVRAPEAFCARLLSPDAGSRRGSSASFMVSNSDSRGSKMGAEGVSLLGNDPHKLQNYVNRLLDVRIQKWVMFSAAWNEIIDYFRTEDIISNQERDNLKFSRFDGFSQAIYLPVFQTAGVIENALLALERPLDDKKDRGPITDAYFFQPIHENVIMSTAVSEVWELGSFLFIKMLGAKHNDDIVAVMNLILKWSEKGTMVSHLKMEKMRSVTSQFVALIKTLQKSLKKRKPTAPKGYKPVVSQKPKSDPTPQKGMRRVVSASSFTTFGGSQGGTTGAPTDNGIEAFSPNMTISRQRAHDSDAVILDALRDQVRDKFRGAANALKGLLKDVAMDAETKDVADRLTFLLSIEDGFLWDDAYASYQLDEVAKNDMFLKVLTKVHGLVACHPDDVEPNSAEVRRRLTFFVNSLFMDIPYAPSIQDMLSWNVLTPYYSEDVTYNKADLEKRTDALGVSTMLYLQTLYKSDWANFLERMNLSDDEKIWNPKFIDETRTWASIRAQTLQRTVNGMMYFEKALRLLANLERLDDSTTDGLMGEKFGYIVSCQVYGNMKKNQDPKADDIDQLMHRFPHLRVAYIDEIRLNRAGKSNFFSVLVKSDGNGKIQEVYRVKLPGNPIIGEGKPENQNHAIIFTRGECLQTIDMNQEMYFEEALKMRNALQEFIKPQGPLPMTILGFREHIFTGSVSSLANYMALQETSFVTLGQRVLAKPLCIRLHYGHPDVFDKLFFMTRGGISKSSKGINLSEDIFAGYNNTIRGGSVGFKEYLQIGKGRDVGMSQIYKFEAKLSQGAGEQSLSRDVYRVCHRLDFCRLLSLYFGGIGHYFSNVLTVLTIYCVVYLMLFLALFDCERIGTRIITPMGTIQMLLGGLGLLQTIPLFATLGVEKGWWPSLREIIHVFITGGPLHFMFHIQTKAYYMAQTILVGGAKYRPTGRGFVTQHTPMDEQYRFFASSHLYLGVEMGASLILMGIYTQAGQYFGRTWSLWLASLSFLASPFWFNPLSFDWNVVVSDYGKYLRWMRGDTGDGSKSWSVWWSDDNSHFKSMPFTSKTLFILKSIIFFGLAWGIAISDLFKVDTTLNKPWVGVGKVLIFIVALLIIGQLFIFKRRYIAYPIRRTIGIFIGAGLLVAVITIFAEDVNCLRYALAAYYGIGGLCQLGLLAGVKVVKYFYFVHDLVCGHIIFIPLFLLAALQIPNYIQTWLLYHNALSTGVVVSDILRYARKTQEASSARGDSGVASQDMVDQIQELRKIVQKQEQLLQSAGLAGDNVNAIAGLIQPPAAMGPSIPPPAHLRATVHSYQPMNLNMYGAPQPDQRGSLPQSVSLSGLDVWGDMAMGVGDLSSSPAVVEPTYQSGSTMPTYTVPYPRNGTNSSGGDFSFSQPVNPPPR